MITKIKILLIIHLIIIISMTFVNCADVKVKEEPKFETKTEITKEAKVDIRDVKLDPNKLICDTFDIIYDTDVNSVNISLQTDLPDATEIMVSVSRTYWWKGVKDAYSIDYYSIKSTVGKFRTTQNIMLKKAKWDKELKSQIDFAVAANRPSQVSRVSGNVNIRIVVPMFQANPAFGKRNENLKGKKVQKGDFRIVESEVTFKRPLNAKLPSIKYANSNNLLSGKTYKVSKKTPLMPELNPSNVKEAMKDVKYIQQGGNIKITKIVKKNNTTWYNVIVSDEKKRTLGYGWINSTVLLGQKIEIVN